MALFTDTASIAIVLPPVPSCVTIKVNVETPEVGTFVKFILVTLVPRVTEPVLPFAKSIANVADDEDYFDYYKQSDHETSQTDETNQHDEADYIDSVDTNFRSLKIQNINMNSNSQNKIIPIKELIDPELTYSSSFFIQLCSV